jgi:hypothetical protein
MGLEVRMDPVMLVLVPGFLGGLVLAFLIFRMQAPSSSLDSLRRHPVSTDVINMARIRVDGIGGFGLVVMALTVAWFVLRIRQHVAIGLGLGVLLAIVLVVVRRRNGPMPSSGETPGANSTLSIDDPIASDDRDDGRLPPGRIHHLTA